MTTINLYKDNTLMQNESTKLIVTDHYVEYCMEKLKNESVPGEVTAMVIFEDETREYSFHIDTNELIVRSDKKIFKNRLWNKRDYDCTNVIFCEAKEAPGPQWDLSTTEYAESLKVNHLYTQAGIKYFGYL